MRKKCISCNEFLISFQGQYLHPDTPCAGIRDAINIEATIDDDVLHEEFIKLYGTPDIDDYDRLLKYEKILNNPFIKFIMKILRISH